ncbi:MAG: DUF2628 domain-containing protein [Alphaproteobacteria bacterium]|nr:DUF2628 domain-containing protein [Alphaproteobacteria bacterium]MBF0251644.1 DUF2628 domain-containing protein [Alphaproteobacteria bacterium]
MIYTVHVQDAGPRPGLAVVKDGFSWPAAVFGFLWAVAVGAWEAALALLALELAVGVLLEVLVASEAVRGAVQVGLAVVVGLAGNEIKRWTLERRGRKEVGVVSASNREDAERRYLDAHPNLTETLLRVA